jgi:hypothetical protein
MPTKKPAKQTKSRANVKSSSTLKNKPRFNKKIALLLTVIIAGIGAYFLFFADAATNNCQAIDRVQICDVDMTAGGSDTVLSVTGEAQSLGSKGWGVYYGTDFRAPTTEYSGAVPITRVYNEGATLHDWVTDTQKTAKEAKYGKLINQGVSFFAWKTQVKDTVPVYRLGRGGSGSQNIYSVDKAWVDKMLAQDANNPDGWKKDQFGPFIAFYAYPPNYKVADQVNPYDCSIEVNFLSDRCKTQRESLAAASAAGAIPKTGSCPQTYDAYKKAPFPGQLPADCQKFWNVYAQDCSRQEVFLSDNCKGPREQLAREMERQAKERAEAAARARAEAAQRVAASRSGGGGRGGSSSGNAISNNNPGAINCSRPEYFVTPACKTQRDNLAAHLYYSNNNTGSGWSPPPPSSNGPPKGACAITWKMELFWGSIGNSTGRKFYNNVSYLECYRLFNIAKKKTTDALNRRHYGYKLDWDKY